MGRFAEKCFTVIGLSLISAVLAIVVAYVDRTLGLEGVAHVTLRAIPLIPLGLMLFAIVRWIESLDELQRLVHLQAFVIQVGATALLVMGYGTLADAGIVPDLSVRDTYPFLWVAMFAFWALGQFLVRRKYR